MNKIETTITESDRFRAKHQRKSPASYARELYTIQPDRNGEPEQVQCRACFERSQSTPMEVSR